MNPAPPNHAAPAVEYPALLRVVVQPSLAEAREASRKMRDFLAQQGLSEDELQTWELAGAEALNNAVNYVPAGRAHLPVLLEVIAGTGGVEVRVTDHTAGFDMPGKAELPPDDSEHGRGLFLIQTLTDSAEYLRGGESNVLILRRASPSLARRPPHTVAALEATLAPLTEDLAASYESLSAIFQFTSELCHTDEPLHLVGKWMQELARITSADWHSFHTLDASREWLSRVVSSNDEAPAIIPLDKALPGLAVHAIVGRQDISFNAATKLAPEDPLASLARSSSGIVHPVFIGGEVLGIVAFGRHVEADPFTSGQINVIHTFADFLGSQVRMTQVQREAVASRVFHRELEIAANIQQSLLPRKIVQPPGVFITGEAQNAKHVGGDFYDVIHVSNNCVMMVIADVMGKGVAAALFASILRSQIRARMDLAERPGDMLTWLNRTLFADLERVEMFITTQIVFLDVSRRTGRVSSAGHCPLLLASAGGEVMEFQADGPPLGIVERQHYLEQTFILRAGARALMFTDGVIDARNLKGASFGLPALREWFASRASAAMSGPETKRDLLRTLDGFRRGCPASDDLTFLLTCDMNLALTRSSNATQNPPRR